MDAHEHIIAGEAALNEGRTRTTGSPASLAKYAEATAHFTAALARAALVGGVVGPGAVPGYPTGGLPEGWYDGGGEDEVDAPLDPDVVDLDPRQGGA